VIYRTICWHDLVEMLVEASVTTAVIMMIVVFAGLFSWAASTSGVVDACASWLLGISGHPLVTILLIDLLLLFLGMFLDAISISYLLMPILIPVLAHHNIDPVWYGVIFISALAIGQATPPVGVNLFTAANLVETDVDGVAREAIPYVIAAAIVLVLISILPQLSLWLPVWAGVYKY
jgi:C4-dicarboxylate transporter DctM subunit